MTPQEARARLLQLYLQQDNLKNQLEAATTEIRDLRNYVAGHEASSEAKASGPSPTPTE